MLTITQLNTLRDASKHAYQCELQTKIPCELILAQWAQESGWGSHSPANNCFGIKEYVGALGKQLLYTREYFTEEEARVWVAAKPGRTANIEDITPTFGGKFRYVCQDWFATFPSLSYCFMKRASLFHSPTYQPSLNAYTLTGNFVAFAQDIAKTYATDPNYSREILSIASMPEVQAAIKEARSA